MPRKKRPKPLKGAEKFTEPLSVGIGTSGTVFRMRDITTQELVAVKQVPRGGQINKYVYREMVNHKRLLHRNLIKFREVFLTDAHISVVMEYASGGDLLSFVLRYQEQHGHPLPEHLARFFFDQILRGVAYMHSKGVCHRDLKLENILLSSDGSGDDPPVVKICDFGFSKSARHSNPHSVVGTTFYCAPEILRAGIADEQYSGEMCDVWSLGVILYVMLVGCLPFGAIEKSNFHLVQMRIANGEYHIPPHLRLSESCTRLLSAILEVDPAQRIPVDAIWEHPWMVEGGCRKGSIADEGAMSTQSDENITSLCLEALNQPRDGEGAEVAGALGSKEVPESMLDQWAEEEFSDIIHMASEVGVGTGDPWGADDMGSMPDDVSMGIGSPMGR